MKNHNTTRALSLIAAAMTFTMMTAGCSGQSSSSSSEESESAAVTSTTEAAKAESLSETSAADQEKSSESSLFSARDLAQDYGQPTSTITLDGSSAKIEGSGASAEGSVITITQEGIYLITGKLTDGQIIVDADQAKVQLVLDNAEITCKTGPAIYGKNSDKIFLTLAKDSKNSLTDGETYADTSEEAPDACVFSKDSLTINGPGSLTINGNLSDGIHSSDDVVLTGGELTITAVNHGIKGKDYFAAAGGTVKITSGGDGIKSTNAEEEGKGFIYIEDGSFTIDAQQDGIQAETDLTVVGGGFDITSGGGSENSTKTHTDDFGGGRGFGGKMEFGTEEGQMPEGFDPSLAEGQMPEGFTPGQFGGEMPEGFAPEGTEDGQTQFGGRGPHGGMARPGDTGQEGEIPEGMTPPDMGQIPENGEIPEAGQLPEEGQTAQQESSADSETTISTKGIKAGGELNISGGKFKINSADDALHSNGKITLTGGSFELTAGDDGINSDAELEISGSAEVNITKSYEGIEAAVITVSGGDVSLVASDDGFNASDGTAQGAMGTYSEGASLSITGGTVYVNASGDGLDSNGNINISGGSVTVDGPTNSGNGALDSNGEINITGGTLIAAGMSGMAEAPGSSSTQYSVSCTFESTYDGGTKVSLVDENGDEVMSFAPAKSFDNIIFSSPEISSGKTYKILADGEEAGTFTAEDVTSYIGRQSMMGGGMNFGGHGGRNGAFSEESSSEQL